MIGVASRTASLTVGRYGIVVPIGVLSAIGISLIEARKLNVWMIGGIPTAR
jgi:hypothetical protein